LEITPLNFTIRVLLHLNTDQLLEYFRMWGPSLRTCIDLVRNKITMKQLCSTAKKAAERFVAAEDFMDLAHGRIP
jgi:hypothetical protein